MFQIQYKSDGGCITLGGGNNPLFNVTSLSGFEMPPREFKTVTFAGENGITTIGKRDTARTLTIAGDLWGGQDDILRAIKAFYYDGELICIFGSNMRRKISVKCSTLEDFKRYAKSGISSFAVQFIADYPYFTDMYKTTVPIYSLKNLVTDTFTLPCVFTERKSSADILNRGDKYVYPTIIMKNTGTATSGGGGIIIKNDRTGAQISLPDYITEENEVITTELAERKITSSIHGNITPEIGDNTNMAEFYLEPGVNHLSLVNNSGQFINTVAVFSNEYLGCVL